MREGIRGISEFVWRRVRGDPAAVFPPSEPPRCTQYPFGECLRLGLLPCVPADPVLVPALGYGLPLLAAVLAACAACTRRKPPEGYVPLGGPRAVSARRACGVLLVLAAAALLAVWMQLQKNRSGAERHFTGRVPFAQERS